MFDYHMHSTVSFDGHDSPEAMAAAAQKAGLREICFTDHMDFRRDLSDRAMVFDTDTYHKAYDTLEIPGVKIRRGLEFGMQPDNAPVLKQVLEKERFDFVLGSVHFVDYVDVYDPPYWEGKTILQAEQQYLEETLACVESHTDFDVLAHLTYISKAHAHPAPRPVDFETHKAVIDQILRVLAQKGKGLEMNTSGVDRCGDFLPYAAYFRRFKELGGRIVTIGSDAHNTARVGQYTGRACEILKEIFGYVCTFEGRNAIYYKL